FLSARPEVNGEDDRNQRQPGAEFADDVSCAPGIRGERVEEALNKEVVAGVQQNSGPEAARFQAQPGKDKADADDHYGESGQAVPRRSSGIVVGKDQDGIVPQ